MIRKFIFMLILICLNTASTYSETIKFNQELRVIPLIKNVYIVEHNYPWNSNSLIIKVSKKEVVLIDTPYHSQGTETILDWIGSTLKPETITAINTGFHIDNLGGNGALRNRGIDIYGADLTVKMLQERGQKTQNQIISWLKSPEQDKYIKTYREMKFTEPNLVYPIKKGLSLNIGKYHFDVYYPGESHSPDNVTVYIPELKTLFGGCMVKSLDSETLGFTGDANLEEWPRSIEKLMARYPSAEHVIPHHGKWGGMELLEHTLKLFEKND